MKLSGMEDKPSVFIFKPMKRLGSNGSHANKVVIQKVYQFFSLSYIYA